MSQGWMPTINPMETKTMTSKPEKIVSFEVTPQSCLRYPSPEGKQMISLTKDFITCLDANGKLWVVHPGKGDWICLN